MRRLRNSRTRRKWILIKLLGVLALIIFLLILMDTKVRPIIYSIITYRVNYIASIAINKGITNVLAETGFTYDDLVKLGKDSEGRVTSLQIDSIVVNQMKAAVHNEALRQLKDLEHMKISIPIGTLFGGKFLAGRGPCIDFIVLPSGYADARIASSFESQGVNQTHHQVIIEITTSIVAVIPGYTTTVEVPYDYCIAQTVIVGNIPEAYTYIDGAQKDIIDNIADYKARVIES